MPRSAKQRETRRWKRQQWPTLFPLMQLPCKLQLRVLCKCDPLTALNLLKASANVRSLYFRYPATALPSIVAEIPAHVRPLFNLSWNLENTPGNIFDPKTPHLLKGIGLLLKEFNLLEYSGSLATSRVLTSDPLRDLYKIIDFYLEVHDAAELLGRCMAIGFSKFLDPTVHARPITLSENEHCRISGALWILKVFQQLKSKTFGQTWMPADPLADAFIVRLQPWQIDYAVSLERKLQSEYRCDDSVDYVGPVFPGPVERLLRTSYIENYFSSVLGRVHFSHTVQSLQARGRTRVDAPVSHDPGVLSTEVHPTATSSSTRYKSLYRHLGIGFWDPHRLQQWGVASAADLLTASDDAHRRLGSPDDIFQASCSSYGWRSSCDRERYEEQQIIKWTRDPENFALWERLNDSELRPEISGPRTLCDICALDAVGVV